MSVGRPTKLTFEVKEKILHLIRQGNYKEVAVRAAGVGVSTFCRWMEQNREFREAVDMAETEAEVEMVAHVKLAAKNDPVHGRWWLERKFPERWGRRDKVAVSGPDGAAVSIKIETVIVDANQNGSD